MIPNRSPDEVFRCWVDPELLRRWWPPEAKVDPRLAGSYEFSWPKMGWRLRGRFVRFETGKTLEFTWTWDHESSVTKRVVVLLSPGDPTGTEVLLEHGPYSSDPRDVGLRQEHLEGWMYFLQRLVSVNDPHGPDRPG